MEEIKANPFFFPLSFQFSAFYRRLLIVIYGLAQAAPKSDAANFISGATKLNDEAGMEFTASGSPCASSSQQALLSGKLLQQAAALRPGLYAAENAK